MSHKGEAFPRKVTIDLESIEGALASVNAIPSSRRTVARLVARRVAAVFGAGVAYSLFSHSASAQITPQAVTCEEFQGPPKEWYCAIGGNNKKDQKKEGKCRFPVYRKCCTDYGDNCNKKFLRYEAYSWSCCKKNADCKKPTESGMKCK